MQVSVVIPTLDRAASLGEALAALQRQTLPAHQIIVVDDGSTDETAARVRGAAGVHFLRQARQGPAAARNTGSKVAQGDVIAFTDDDCVPPPDWLERLARGFADQPEVAAVGGPCRAPEPYLKQNPYARYEWALERGMLPSPRYIAWLTGGRLAWRESWPGQGDYVGGMDCPAGRSNNIGYRREVFESLNGFDESFPLAAGEDADLKIRMCLAGHRLLWLDDMIVEHRHAYTRQRFCRQHATYGRGVIHLERKYQGQPTPRWRAALRLLKRLALSPKFALGEHRGLFWPRVLAGLCDAWGQVDR